MYSRDGALAVTELCGRGFFLWSDGRGGGRRKVMALAALFGVPRLRSTIIMRVLVGGTFDGLHEGHRALLGTAVEATVGGKKPGLLWVGLTAGDLARRKERQVRSWSERELAIRRFVRDVLRYSGPLEIKAIDTTHGPALEARFDTLVVSDELAPVARRLNLARHVLGLAPLNIKQCAMVCDSQGHTISATRIHARRASEIRSAL